MLNSDEIVDAKMIFTELDPAVEAWKIAALGALIEKVAYRIAKEAIQEHDKRSRMRQFMETGK